MRGDAPGLSPLPPPPRARAPPRPTNRPETHNGTGATAKITRNRSYKKEKSALLRAPPGGGWGVPAAVPTTEAAASSLRMLFMLGG